MRDRREPGLWEQRCKRSADKAAERSRDLSGYTAGTEPNNQAAEAADCTEKRNRAAAAADCTEKRNQAAAAAEAADYTEKRNQAAGAAGAADRTEEPNQVAAAEVQANRWGWDSCCYIHPLVYPPKKISL